MDRVSMVICANRASPLVTPLDTGQMAVAAVEEIKDEPRWSGRGTAGLANVCCWPVEADKSFNESAASTQKAEEAVGGVFETVRCGLGWPWLLADQTGLLSSMANDDDPVANDPVWPWSFSLIIRLKFVHRWSVVWK